MRLSSVLLLCVLSAGCGEPEKSGFKPSSGAHPPASASQISVSAAAFSPDGKLLLVNYEFQNITGENNKNLRLVDVETGKDIWVVKGPVGNIVFTPDGKSVKIIGKDKVTSLNLKNGADINVVPFNRRAMMMTEDLTLAVIAVSDERNKRTLYLYDVNKNQVIRELLKEVGDVYVWISPDNKNVLFGFQAGRYNQFLLFTMMDLSNGKILWTLNGKNLERGNVIFSPDAKHVIISSWDDQPSKTRLYLKDVATGNTIRTYEGHAWGAKAFAFTPDGRFLYAMSDDGVLKKWHYETGKEEWSLTIPNDFFAISSDGKRAFAASGATGLSHPTVTQVYEKLTIWDLETKKKLRTLSP